MCVDQNNKIHTAGNDLFITYSNGEAVAKMELRCVGQQVHEKTNLRRSEIDFGEVHCQLLVVDTALRLGFYDEELREGIEMDSGLTFRKAGCRIMVQPDSVVCLYYPIKLKHAIDVPFYLWKWNIPEIVANFDYLKNKWNIDLGTLGGFKRYLVGVNARVGLLSQIYPSSVCVFLDRSHRVRAGFNSWSVQTPCLDHACMAHGILSSAKSRAEGSSQRAAGRKKGVGSRWR